MQSRRALWTIFTAGVLVGAVACSGGGAAIAQQIQQALDILFDNTQSGLQGTNVQAAIDEVDGNVDANQAAVAANQGAIQGVGNDLDALEAVVAGLGGPAGGLNLYTQGAETVTGLRTVPANGGVADIQPPAGETWVIDFIAAASGSGNINYGYTDGVIEVVPNNFGGFGVAGKSIVISNSMCLRLKNNNAAPRDIFFSAHKIAAELVFHLSNVANGNTIEFRPPQGETWVVARAFTSAFNQEFIGVTNGALTAQLWQGMPQEYTLFPINNTDYLTYTNNSGGTIGVAIAALKLP